MPSFEFSFKIVGIFCDCYLNHFVFILFHCLTMELLVEFTTFSIIINYAVKIDFESLNASYFIYNLERCEQKLRDTQRKIVS